MSLVRHSDISYPLCPHPSRSQRETSACFLKVKCKFQKSNLNFGELKQKKIKTFREYNIVMWEVVNMNDNLAVGKTGRKITAPFLNNNFICLCKPTATFSYIFFKPALLWRTLQHAEQEVARGFLFQQSPPLAATALREGYTTLTLQRWVFSSLSDK